MRLYCFTNMYLSQIQRGIQTAHVVSELAVHYGVPSHPKNAFQEWAYEHKTIVVLNGGPQVALQEIRDHLQHGPLCGASFQEDSDSLNMALTAVGVIVPERIYEYARFVREGGEWEGEPTELTAWEMKLVEFMNSCSLA